jgi:hypothetical protein
VNPLANDEVAVYGGRLWSWPYDGEFGSGSLAIGGKDTSFSFSVGNSYFRQGKTQPVFTNNGWTVYLNQGTGILGSLITHYVFRFDSGGTIITAAVSNPTPNAGSANHAAAGGTLDRSWFWGNGVLRVATDDAATFEALTILPEGVCGVAPSPSGMFLMSSDAGTVVKSSDYGATWVLPPTTIGPVVFENCRDNYRWIFGGGANIRFTPDFGETFVNKIGNLLYNAPLIDVTILRYVK